MGESLQMAKAASTARSETALRELYLKRISAMKSFFDALDGVVATLLALDDLRLRGLDDLRLRGLQKLLGSAGKKVKA